MIEREPVPIDTRLQLEELNLLNDIGTQGKNVYLTSRDDITSDPQWLEGAGGLQEARTGAIIVNEEGSGVVDVFYFLFWAYNYGGEVLGKNLGRS